MCPSNIVHEKLQYLYFQGYIQNNFRFANHVAQEENETKDMALFGDGDSFLYDLIYFPSLEPRAKDSLFCLKTNGNVGD